MKNIFEIIKNSPLFLNFTYENFQDLLKFSSSYIKDFDKGTTIFYEGDQVSEIGIAIKGKLHLIKDDIWGNTSVIAEITPPDIFAESVVVSDAFRLPVSILAKEKSSILFINYKDILSSYDNGDSFQEKIISNMVLILAKKNQFLSSKIEHLTKRSTKERLLSYLNEQSKLKNSKSFDIPFNRQELADYLSVERSALSYQMMKLKSDGIIDYRKNHFLLI